MGERSQDVFDSTWLGVVKDSQYVAWRVVGWTGEPPNHPGSSLVHFHAYAQFNSDHPGLANFAFCDGSIQSVKETIDQRVFRSLGTIQGREIVPEY